MRTLLILVAFALLLDPPSATAAASHPPSGTVIMESLTYDGAGCPPGSAGADISPDGQALTVTYSNLTTEVGPGTPATRAIECRLRLKLRVPKGWSYALENVDFRGYTFLEDGVSAEQRTRFHIQGEAPETGAVAQLDGPADEDYLLQALGTGEPLRWSRCGKGKFVDVRTRLSLSNQGAPDATGVLVVSSTDAQIYRLKWQRCDP
jgi:hypothetical protein